jgi:hypothetical protein
MNGSSCSFLESGEARGRSRQGHDAFVTGLARTVMNVALERSIYVQIAAFRAGTKAAHRERMDNDHDPSSAPEDSAPIDTIVMLPTDMSAAQIASACRDAAMAFVNESKHWGKAELGMWLSGTYASVTKHASKGSDGQVWPVPLLRDIDVRLIDRIMQSARTEIFETLTAIATDGSASFVLRALIAGTVIRCEDGEGGPAWAPTKEAPRLADRVLSLFAVDYLARPGDYETELHVCAQCETVAFDGAARERGACNHGLQQSALAPRRRSTLPYPPLGA